MLRIVLITNHPPPFRIPIYHRIARMPDVELRVIFCSAREPNRQWELPPLQFKHVFLKERFVTRGSNFIHNNPDVITTLMRLAPDVIVTTGFNPTYLYAFGYAVAKGIPHIPMTDGTATSEEALSRWHKVIRRLVYSRSQAFIAASKGGMELYQSYGIPPESCFQSCLCIDNETFQRDAEPVEKKYDFIFCGRIVQDKNPLFALDVARGAAQKLGRKVSILFVGTGEQEEDVKAHVRSLAEWVEADFNGHADQHELPALYASARIFLFPTARDVWGVVANEACAAGLPVIVSPHAGVVGELIVDGVNGFVRPLDVQEWVSSAVPLLTDSSLYQRYAEHSLALVSRFTFDHAAAGIVDACRHATGIRPQGRPGQAWRNAG